MTKSYANAFLKDVIKSGRTEGQALKAIQEGSRGSFLRLADGSRAVDIALPGKANSAVTSMRAQGEKQPDLKLRRYILSPGRNRASNQVAAATAGVDLEAGTFRALVEETARSSQLDPRRAVSATIKNLLDTASERQTNLESQDSVELSKATPDGVVKGMSRAAGSHRVDDYDRIKAPNTRDEPQLERRMTVDDSAPASGKMPVCKDPDDRAARIKAAALRKHEQLTQIKISPSKRGPEIGD